MVIPAYQAVATVADVVAAVRASLPTAHVIVVDDGSTDGGHQAATRAGAAVHRHDRNLGKGAALRTGLAAALSGGAEYIVTLDADGQHPPLVLPRMVALLQAGTADLVLGTRARNTDMPLSRRTTNWLSSLLASRIAGIAIPDAQTGCRAFVRAVAERVRPQESHYDWELAFLLGAAVAGFRVTSVAIPTIYGAGSHFGLVRDTLRMSRVFLRHHRRFLRGAG